MTLNSRELIEWQLGPPSAYIMRPDDRPFLMEWARLIGLTVETTRAMSNVELTNLYCCLAGNASELQRIAAQTMIAMLTNIAPYEAPSPYVSINPNPVSHYRTDLVIRIASLGHPIMLVGPAGCGKTTIAYHVAQSLALQFYITSTINETHELLGFVDGYGKYHATPFRRAFEGGGLWTADEIDAWDAAALLAANSALANGISQFPDVDAPISRNESFRMVATANTFGTGADREYVGRNELDAASLDRFATIDVDYDLELERMFAGTNDRWLDRVWAVRKTVMDKKIRHVVSSRAIGMGAAALAAGIDWETVERVYLFKGMSDKDRGKIP